MARRRRAALASLVLVAGGLTAAVTQPAASASTAVTPAVAAHPVPVSDVSVRMTAQGEQLSWIVPPAKGLTAIEVRRAPGAFAPGGLSQGTEIARLTAGTSSVLDSSVEPESSYSYSVFAVYGSNSARAVSPQVGTGAGIAQPNLTARTGTITGTVTDAHGDPLHGVGVRISQATPFVSPASDEAFGIFAFLQYAAYQVRTAADGSFTISHVGTGSYRLCFTASTNFVSGGDNDALGYQDYCRADDVLGVSGQATALGTTVLPDNTGGTITGEVLDAKTGAPIQNVGVFIQNGPTGPTGEYARTGATGRFQVEAPAGSYQLCFDASSSTSQTDTTGYLSACQTSYTTVAAGAVTTLRRWLQVGGAVSGTVRGANDVPLAGVEVLFSAHGLGFALTTTAADGSYTLRGLPAHPISFCAQDVTSLTSPAGAPGYGTVCTAVTATLGQTLTSTDVTLPAGGAVAGQLTSSTGVPLSGALVLASSGNGDITFGQTNAQGRYTINSLTGGTRVAVCFLAYTYPQTCYNGKSPLQRPNLVTVVGGSTIPINQALPAGSPGSLDVAVQDAGGHPLVGADVAVLSRCAADEPCSQVPLFPLDNTVVASLLSGGDGHAVVPQAAPGRYAVCVFARLAAGGTSTTRYQDRCNGTAFTVVVTSGASTALTIKLAAGGAVTGTVTDRHGRPLAGVGIVASTGDEVDSGSGFVADLTAADGTYRIEGLPAGTTTVCFDPSDAIGLSTTGYVTECYNNSRTTPTPIPITGGAVTTGIDAQLLPGAAISGTVTGPDGNPLPNAEVDIQTLHGGLGMTTDLDGRYEIFGLAPGQYTVCFQDGAPDGPPTGYAPVCWQGVAIGAPTPIHLASGQLLTGIDGQLPLGAEVTGTVTTGGQPLASGFAVVIYPGAPPLYEAVPITDGTYDLTGIPAASFAICFDGSASGAGLDCYHDKVWGGDPSVLPAGLTLVPLSAGVTTTVNETYG